MAVTLSFYYLLMYERIREVFHNIKPREVSCIGIAMNNNNPIIVHRYDKCNDIDCNSIITEIIEGLADIFDFNYNYKQIDNDSILMNVREKKITSD